MLPWACLALLAAPARAAEKANTGANAAAPTRKTYMLADLPAITIFGNDRTEERLRALAAIKTISADQVKGLIEQRGGDGLDLRVPDGDRAQRLLLKATGRTQVALDGRAAKMADLKPLQAALVTLDSDRSTALRIEAQNPPKSGDGKTHQILAMAVAGPKSSRLYVVEAVADLRGAGIENGEYLLWTLTPSGQVIHKELLKKKDDSYDPPPGTLIIPLPDPQEGAIVMGPFGKLSGTNEWCLFRVDGQGKTVAELKGIFSCHSAVLTADTQGILAVGNDVGAARMYGMLWRLDLDGKILSTKTYERRTLESFNDIVLADDQGGFIIAEDSPKAINKFGVGESSVWLLRCDREGKVLAETSFPGRQPRIRALGGRQFAVLYDAGSTLSAGSRVRAVDLQLKQQWERKLGFAGFSFDQPGLCPTAAGGLVLAGPAGVLVAGGPMGQIPDQPRPGLEVAQWDREGRGLFSVSIPAIFPAVNHDICAACAADYVYVAARTTGFLFRDGVESSIYRIPLPAAH
jgi:hypothetical protein